MQKTIKLLFVLIVSTLLNASTNWAPVVMGDITTFVPYTTSTPPPVPAPDSSIVLTSGEEVINQIANKGDYKYYKIYAHAGERVHVDLYNQDANGNLYVKVGAKASKENYDCKSINGEETHSTEHDSCSLLVERDSFVYIAVHAPTYGCNTNVKHTVMAYLGDYGDEGPYRVGHLDSNGLRLFYPITIKKKPLVIFLPGFFTHTPEDANAAKLSTFIASHGYSVIYRPNHDDAYHPNFDKLKNMINAYKDKLDTSRIGIVGFSHGGGIAFKLMKELNSLHYGSSGKFMMPIEPMYAIGMNQQDIHQLNNMNFVMMRFGSKGQDPRTNFVEYKLLDGQEVDKNYINLNKGLNSHGYLFEMKKDFLSKMDALMAYTLKNDQNAHDIALDGAGKYNPKNVETRLDVNMYSGSAICPEDEYNGIDYCAEVQF